MHKAAGKSRGKFILSGKLICTECGELMVGESGTSKTGEIYTYYKCTNKKKSAQNCASKAIRKEVIEEAVYNAIIWALQGDNFIREVARKAVEIHNADIEESKELKILNRQKA
ncbi:MAG: zinc ribbon domain-containing protein, partial [Christensenellaceae bacterium]